MPNTSAGFSPSVVDRGSGDLERYQAMMAQHTVYSPLAEGEYGNSSSLNNPSQGQAGADWRGHENTSSPPSLPPISERARSNEAFLYTTVDPALANLRGSQRRSSRAVVSPKGGSDAPQAGGTVDPNAKVMSAPFRSCHACGSGMPESILL